MLVQFVSSQRNFTPMNLSCWRNAQFLYLFSTLSQFRSTWPRRKFEAFDVNSKKITFLSRRTRWRCTRRIFCFCQYQIYVFAPHEDKYALRLYNCLIQNCVVSNQFVSIFMVNLKGKKQVVTLFYLMDEFLSM